MQTIKRVLIFKWGLLLLITGFAYSAYSQNYYEDSFAELKDSVFYTRIDNHLTMGEYDTLVSFANDAFDYYYNKGEVDRALYLFNICVYYPVGGSLGDTLMQMISHKISFLQHHTDTINVHYATLLHINSFALKYFGEYDKADPFMENAVAIYERTDTPLLHLSSGYYNLAGLRFFQNKPIESYYLYKKALIGFSSTDSVSSPFFKRVKFHDAASAYLGIALSMRETQQIELAADFDRKAYEVLKNHFTDSDVTVIATINLASDLEQLGKFKEAIEYADISESWIAEHGARDRFPDVYYSLHAVRGSAFTRLGNYLQAHKNLRELENHTLTAFKGDSAQLAEVYSMMANNYAKQNLSDSAVYYYSKALLYNPASINVNASVAETYASKGEPEPAIRYARINLNHLTGNKWSDTEVPRAVQFDDDYQGYKNTLSLAKYYLARYNKQENFTDLVMSLSFSNLSDTLISHYRDATLIGGKDELLAEDYHRIAEVGIQAGYEAYLHNPQSKYLDNYLQFITQSTAYKLNAEVNQAGSNTSGSSRQITLLQEIRLLKNQLAAFQTKQDSLQQKILNDQLFADRIEAFELSYELQQKKEVARSNELFSKISSSAIQSHLLDGEALAMYFMGRDQVFSVLVEKEGVRIAAIRHDEEFDKTLTGYYRGIKTTSPDFNEMATAMYHLLMAPFGESLTNIKSLTIVPDGTLSQVPFEAFVNPENQHFLIEDMAVSYSYSVFLWIRNHTGVNVKQEITFAGFAPVFSDKTDQIIQNEFLVDAGVRDGDSIWRDGKNLRPLPFSKNEVVDIAQLFTSKGYRSETFLNNDASEENFKNNVQQFEIVHIATHGISSYTNPELSGLFFDQSNMDITGNLTNDGFMFADEIYTLPIKADLVVLSACKTGAGKLAEGEGVLALPRGFIFSGVPNLVVSLWKIHDQKTKDLMVDFYTNLLGGKTYARALQQAKIKQIKQAQLPMDWSGIVLIGE